MSRITILSLIKPAKIKGGLKRNHEFIRRFVPQGQSFDSLSQRDIDIMINQINSIRRDHLNGKSPFEALSKPQTRAVRKLGYRPVSPDSVNLSMDLFKKNKSK